MRSGIWVAWEWSMLLSETDLWQYSTRHPDCTHCVTMLDAMTVWEQKVHDTCPCICHQSKTTQAVQERKEAKRKRRKNA